jgi:DNA-binding GntR family transcriptional regulator
MTRPVDPSAVVLPPVRARVLSEQIMTALREAIVNGQLPPGHHLVEADVAAQMGVSRVPVREAIRLLDQEGLVEFFPHRGALVVGMSQDELDAVYEMRAVIEAHAIRRASQNITPEELAALESLLAKMAALVEQRQIDKLVEADVQFHRGLLTASGYAFLQRRWEGLLGIVRIRSMQAIDRPGEVADYFISDTVSSHRILHEALVTGDPEAAAAAVREHILAVPPMLRRDSA